MKIQWTDNSGLEAGFQIARKIDSGNWNENYKTVGANTTQYTDTVSFLHKYSYKVRAYDNQGHYSPWSNTVEYTSGMLAQSNFSKMSAYNNGAKDDMQNLCQKFFKKIHFTLDECFFLIIIYID